tara:strand:- start:1354 stop:1929 length:576 start_codon:yes stop_codon:yes gene_type:complete
MSAQSVSANLPAYQNFSDAIAPLDLPMSSSELHGMMCGYLCSGKASKGEEYLRALMLHKNDDSTRQALLALFDVYAVSHQQIENLDFEFQMLLPSDEQPLYERAQAFSEWCDGFGQGLAMCGIHTDDIEEDDVVEAIEHIVEFARLDFDGLSVSEEDERALMEVSEYTRMAVLRIFGDLKPQQPEHLAKTH